MFKLGLRDLEAFLWESADILRGSLDASEFKDYMFGLLFLKRISDTYDGLLEKKAEEAAGVCDSDSPGISAAMLNKAWRNSFFIPESARWHQLKKTEKNIGKRLNEATEAIEEHNTSLKGVLRFIDFTFGDKLSDRTLRSLLLHFSKYRLRSDDLESTDVLGDAYEYLVKQFADSAGKKGGEFYTPGEVSWLLASLIKPQAGMRVYDPTAGSGGMLVQVRNHVLTQGGNPNTLTLYGQEMNRSTWAICKMNMFLHGTLNSDIRIGDTLRDPQHVEGGKLMKFDRVIANPPFSLKKWGKDMADQDPYGRYSYGVPPENKGDLAFVQHMITSLNDKGFMGVVVPNGVLFRGGSERAIRRGIIEDDLLDAVIGLPPRLFYGTSIPATLLLIGKDKPAKRRGKVLFINNEQYYQEGRIQNKLRSEDLGRMLMAYDAFADKPQYSRVVSLDEIRENDYNLNIRRFADVTPPRLPRDARALICGGVPAIEVESESGRDVLQDIGLCKVFKKKGDTGRYEFLPKISSRERIRELFAGKDEAALSQLETWWDKYGESLAGVNRRAKQADRKMQASLKELGYG